MRACPTPARSPSLKAKAIRGSVASAARARCGCRRGFHLRRRPSRRRAPVGRTIWPPLSLARSARCGWLRMAPALSTITVFPARRNGPAIAGSSFAGALRRYRPAVRVRRSSRPGCGNPDVKTFSRLATVVSRRRRQYAAQYSPVERLRDDEADCPEASHRHAQSCFRTWGFVREFDL